ncbi:MATE family efflux transporter [Pseudorhodobacter sp. E13]|uniref:MATE family efflux transporter n=1 Tax=Pseudorhodobacter sp. E13 TaxID=2487931 RepID=UPI000F8D8D6D|nr:MATE family efflux transporter [Pseudorhodobacter sp. E13]RUS63302.1 MATE family efflux transporter [Pseudorhodobacter sp. E13]
MTPPLSKLGHAKAVLTLGLPLVGSHLAQMLLHVTDTVMLGWYGVLELASVVLGASAFFIVFILGSGFGQAVMPMVAQALGRGDEVQVRRDTRMGLWLSIGFGLLCYPVFWQSEAILLALGQQADVSALAQAYLRIAGLGMIPALLVMALKSYLAALEKTQVVLWVTVAAVVLNAGMNYALIFGNWGAPELGVRGAAIASVLTQAVTFVALGFYAHWQPDLRRFNLFQRFWRPDWQAMDQVFKLGWPIGLTGLMEGGLFQASALMMGWIGTMELAAHGIALEVTALAFMVHLGLSNAATVRVGRAMGRGDAQGLRDGAKVALAMSLLFGVAMVVLFLALPAQIVALFLDKANPQSAEIIAFGTILLALSALFQMVDATQVMALGFLRGMQDTRVPMWLAVFSYWVIGIPASYVLAFPLGLGGAGLWLGLTVGLSVAAGLLMWRFWARAPKAA